MLSEEAKVCLRVRTVRRVEMKSLDVVAVFLPTVNNNNGDDDHDDE